jgi:hypothetical protein
MRVFLVGKRTGFTCVHFDQDFVARLTQGRNAGRDQAHARFVIFDFFWDADDHVVMSPLVLCNAEDQRAYYDAFVL